MKLTDAAIWREYQNLCKSTGWPSDACICAVVQNYAQDSDAAQALEKRVRAVVASRIAPHWESTDEYGGGYWLPAAWFAKSAGDVGDYDIVVNPTHWMPLPDHPVA